MAGTKPGHDEPLAAMIAAQPKYLHHDLSARGLPVRPPDMVQKKRETSWEK
jgi:hypothetical protein